MALENRTLNASRNIIWGSISKIVLMLLPFFIRTIFIYTIGLEYLGLNSLFTSILQMLSLAELGFGTAVVYSLYKPLANNDTDTVCAIIAFLKRTYRYVGLLILVLGSILSFLLPKLIHGEVPKDINIYYIYFLYLINTVISYFFAGYKSALLTANQRDDVKSKVITLTSIGQYLLQGIALWVFRNYYAYIVILPLTTLMVNIINAYLTKKYFPQYIAKGKLPKEQMLPMTKQICGLLISRIAGVSRNAVANVMISSSIGLVALAIYSNYTYIVTSLHGLLTIVGSSIVAGVGNSIVKETEQKNHQDFMNFNFMYMWVSGWLFCCFLNLLQPFITLWVGAESTMSFTTVILLCFMFYFTAAGDMRNTYVNATGIWWQNKWRSIVETVVNILLGFILIKRFQIAGVLSSIIVSTVVVNLWYGSTILYTEYFKNHKFSVFILSHLQYLLATILVTAVTYVCCNYISDNTWGTFLVKIIICVIVPNALYILIYHRRSEFQSFKNLAKRILKKQL